MGIRQNIFISVMIHITVIASVFVIAGSIRCVTDRIPANYIAVSLFSEITGSILKTPKSTKMHKDPPTSLQNQGILSPHKEATIPPLFPIYKGNTWVAREDMEGFENISSYRNKSFFPDESILNDNGLNNNLNIITINQHPDKSGGTALNQNSGISKTMSSNQTDTRDINASIRNAIERAKIYPFLARKRKIEGIVFMAFTIDSKGYPQNIKVRKSSGHEILDSAAVKIVKSAAPLPYITGEINIPICFRLTDSQTHTYR